MDDSAWPHHHRRRRLRRTPASSSAAAMSASGSIPLPSHLPRPRRIPTIPASRPRNRKPHHHNPSEKPPSPPKPSNPTTSDGVDDLVLAAAFPREPRVLEAEAEEDGEEEVGEVVNVAEWLWGMGMGQYAVAFEAHEVDGEVLPCLTMEDLRDMGIGAVGARRKLFCAVQRLQPPPPRR